MLYININHIIKYLLIGLISGLSIKYVPTTTLLQNDIIIISIIISIAYAIIDIMVPSISIIKKDESFDIIKK